MPSRRNPFDEYWVVANGYKIIALDGSYDENQLWLDYPNELFIYERRDWRSNLPKSPEVLPKPWRDKTPHEIAQIDWAVVSDHYRKLYHWEKGVAQYPLPFRESQIIGRAETTVLREMEWPGFARDTENKLYTYRWQNGGLKGKRAGQNKTRREECTDWIRTNCAGLVSVVNVIVFAEQRDAIMAEISGYFTRFDG